MEQQGENMFFYGDGASPLVSRLIEAVDNERLAIMRALGYTDAAVPDHTNSKLQGYAESDKSYYDCFGLGKSFGQFRCPNRGTDLTQHRYFQEDIGCGLVLYHSLGQVLNVPTPVSDSIIQLGTVISCQNFLDLNAKNVSSLGLQDLDVNGIHSFLQNGYDRGNIRQ